MRMCSVMRGTRALGLRVVDVINVRECIDDMYIYMHVY